MTTDKCHENGEALNYRYLLYEWRLYNELWFKLIQNVVLKHEK